MKNKIIAWYSIILGILVIAMWVVILLGKNIPEGKTEISLHLASEFIMAISCILSGILIIRNMKVGKHINVFALGMVIYSVLNAAGYYAERNEAGMTALFIALLMMTMFILLLHFIKKGE